VSTFQEVLSSLPSGQINALPATHLTEARKFGEIVTDGHLKTSRSAFDLDLVYLFYGGVFYRRDAPQVSSAAYLPVAFVFGPDILESICRYFPFDTGGIFWNRYGERGKNLMPIDPRFRVQGASGTTPAKIAHYTFDTNQGYLSGPPRQDLLTRGQLCEDLYHFLKAPPFNAGRWWRRMEVQHSQPISLRSHLLWVGFPRGFELVFAQLLEKLFPNGGPTQSKLPHHRYEIFPPKHPEEHADILEKAAYNQVIRHYL
jgi:hypothetical protein